jgi:hypothetical protein
MSPIKLLVDYSGSGKLLSFTLAKYSIENIDLSNIPEYSENRQSEIYVKLFNII